MDCKEIEWCLARDGSAPITACGERRTGDDKCMRTTVDVVLTQRALQSVYQPIVSHDRDTIFAHEILSRPICHGHAVPPELWFSAAHMCDRFLEADLLALSVGLQAFSPLCALRVPPTVFVNVISSSMTDHSFINVLESVLAQVPYAPRQVVIEITESVAFETKAMQNAIADVKSLGIRVALDDVGVGNMSLAAVADLDPDFIKIDRSLIDGIAQSGSRQRLVSLLVQYMESGAAIIAEGVERAEDLQVVRDIGIGLSQGYYWAHPLPVIQISALLSQAEPSLVTAARPLHGLYDRSKVW